MQNTTEAELLWQTIFSQLCQQPQDIQTVNKDGSSGEVWIHVDVNNDAICVAKARQQKPSSRISSTLSISKDEFVELFPVYRQWRAGSISRVKVTEISQKSSYIFALIHRFSEYMNRPISRP